MLDYFYNEIIVDVNPSETMRDIKLKLYLKIGCIQQKQNILIDGKWSVDDTLITVKPFVQSPLNDRDPFDFGRGYWTKGISVLGILIYLLLFFIKFEKKLIKNMFLYRKHIKNYEL